MVGITLSAEQIQAAPPEVRRWIEEQIGDLLGLRRIPPPIEAGRHLVGCSAAEIRSVLDQLQTSLPLVSVLFELARDHSRHRAQDDIRLNDKCQEECRLVGHYWPLAVLHRAPRHH